MEGCEVKSYEVGHINEPDYMRDRWIFNETVYTMETFVKRWNKYMDESR